MMKSHESPFLLNPRVMVRVNVENGVPTTVNFGGDMAIDGGRRRDRE